MISDAPAVTIEVEEEAILQPMAALVHVVEDDDDLRRLLVQGLCEEGFEVVGSEGAETALRQHGERPADVFVIDIGLEDADGRDLCQALRAQGVGAPVLFLTALDATPDRISGFRAGGDDYVTKPFAFSELVARLHALLRRADADALGESGILQLDPTRRTGGVRRCERRAEPDRVPDPGRARGSPGRDAATPRDRRRRLARGRDREREHDRRLHRAPAAQAARAAIGPGDRDRARRRLRASMRARHPRGIRARLLTTNAVVMLLALVVLIGGSNAILRRSLDRDATNLVRARAAAGLATLRVSADRLKVVESPDDAAIDVQIWVFDQHGAVEDPTPSTPLLDRKAAELTNAPGTTIDVGDTRLHAVPVVRDGKRVGTLVAGVGLRAYQPDGAHGIDRLDRARGASVRSRCARIPLDPATCARSGFANDGRSRRLERAQPRQALRSR